MFKLYCFSAFKKAKQAFLLILLVSAVAACKKGSQPDPDPVPGAVPYVQSPGLYISGAVPVGDSSGVAVVWHNGAVSALSSAQSYAYNITTQGNDVYIGGRSGSNVVYWKNGVMSVPQPMPNLYAFLLTGIAVQGNDVYQSGYTVINPKPVYWKNGVFNYLSYDPNKITYIPETAGIAVANTDVYFLGAGFYYWKNSQFVALNYGNSALWSAMTVSGTDIYIAGDTPISTTSYLGYTLAYWKNGTYNSVASTKLVVSSMTVNGADVYIAGYVDPFNNGTQLQGAYFKNGVLTTLPLTSGYVKSKVTSICVDNNNNVYLAGAVYDSSNTPYPAYWKNGVVTILGGANSTATGIVYVP